MEKEAGCVCDRLRICGEVQGEKSCRTRLSAGCGKPLASGVCLPRGLGVPGPEVRNSVCVRVCRS